MAAIRSALCGAGIALGLVLARPGAAPACSVCLAGDPIFSSHGASAQAPGDWGVFVETRGWQQSSGQRPEPAPAREPGGSGGHAGHEHEEGPSSVEERHRSRRLDLYLAWSPLDRLTLSLALPFVANTVRERDVGGWTHASLAGLGDASLAASLVVWRNREVLASSWLELRGFVEAPTGRSEERVDGALDPHLQPGTGSWDGGLGLAAWRRFEAGTLYGSALYRMNREGGLAYEYGDVLLANAALELPLGHASGEGWGRLTPGLELNFRWAGRDEREGEREPDTGGGMLYATPFVRLRLPAFGAAQRAWLRAAVQIPTTDAWLHGRQDEGPVWSIGVGYGF
jgi:hypothetical protein